MDRVEAARKFAELAGWKEHPMSDRHRLLWNAQGCAIALPARGDKLHVHLEFLGHVAEEFPTYDVSIVVVRGCALVSLMRSVHDPRDGLPKPQGGEGIDPSHAALAAAISAKGGRA